MESLISTLDAVDTKTMEETGNQIFVQIEKFEIGIENDFGIKMDLQFLMDSSNGINDFASKLKECLKFKADECKDITKKLLNDLQDCENKINSAVLNSYPDKVLTNDDFTLELTRFPEIFKPSHVCSSGYD